MQIEFLAKWIFIEILCVFFNLVKCPSRRKMNLKWFSINLIDQGYLISSFITKSPDKYSNEIY